MSTPAPKIFGIGLSKTGTTSLAHALEILGYRTKDYVGIAQYRAGDLSSIDLDVVNACDALTDTPIPSFYRELDKNFPNSKFVLTVRDKDGWLKSCRKQFTDKLAAKQNAAHNQLFMDLYGCTVFDEQKFLNGYEKFVNGALEYFKDRPRDLLVINVTAGQGWDTLCPFLGKPIPDIPFPKANVTQIAWMNVNDVVAVAKRAGQITLRAYDQWHSRGPIGRMIRALRGGDAAALKRASKAADRSIARGLRTLNAQIPILSRQHSAVPYAERVKWNHVWLVDPLDGSDAFLGAEGEFTVNIALIQDGVPIYGVVYAPRANVAYYARVGMGAFKLEGDDPPHPLHAPARAGDPHLTTPPHDNHSSLSGSRALTICRVAEGHWDSCALDNASAEWQIAAAHLIAANSGKVVYEGTCRQPPRYNKEHLANECVIVEPGAKAGAQYQ
jgi:3'-phosphoadenosine 5'-phosphosulfate (PAPS) 3'-phosphatase